MWQLSRVAVRPMSVKRLLVGAGTVAFVLVAASCGSASSDAHATSSPSVTPSAVTTPSGSSPSTEPTQAALTQMPCDPSTGFPEPKQGCPDPAPVTGWMRATDEGLTLAPFRSLGNDREGEAYAREHGLDYPFPGDYFDAPNGPSRLVVLTPQTVCSGAILVEYTGSRDANGWDHAVDCTDLIRVASQRRVPVAIWRAHGDVVQASELYRP